MCKWPRLLVCKWPCAAQLTASTDSPNLQKPDKQVVISRVPKAAGAHTTWENTHSNMIKGVSNGVTYAIGLDEKAHDHTNDGDRVVGGLQVQLSTGAAALPCYAYRQQRVDFNNGTVCYRLYRCTSVPYIIMDVQFGTDLGQVRGSYEEGECGSHTGHAIVACHLGSMSPLSVHTIASRSGIPTSNVPITSCCASCLCTAAQSSILRFINRNSSYPGFKDQRAPRECKRGLLQMQH